MPEVETLPEAWDSMLQAREQVLTEEAPKVWQLGRVYLTGLGEKDGQGYFFGAQSDFQELIVS